MGSLAVANAILTKRKKKVLRWTITLSQTYVFRILIFFYLF